MRHYLSVKPTWGFLLLLSPLCAQTPVPPSGWVVIPVSEYTALRSRAQPAPPPPEVPPVAAALSRVEYELKVADGVASGQAVLTIDVLKDGWVRVPIPGGLLVRDAKLDGKPAMLTAEDGRSGRQMLAVLSRRGRSTLTLEIAMQVAATAGEESVSLPPSQSGVTKASLALARPDLELKVTGGLLTGPGLATAGAAWLAYGHGNEALTFTWRRKAEDHHVALPLRMRGSLVQMLGLGEDTTSLYAEAALEIAQGAAAEASIRVPANVTVNQVSGATVADWESRAGTLMVKFLEPAEHTVRFTISAETRLPRSGEIEVPLLALRGVEREGGGVAVDVLGAGEIKDVKAQNLERAEAADLGPAVQSRQSPSLTAFLYRAGGERSLRLQLTRYEQQAALTANIDEARYQVLLTEDGKMLVQARYAVRNNQRSYLKINLPATAAIWSSSLSGRTVKPGQSPDGALLFPLAKGRAGADAPAFAVELLYLVNGPAWPEKGRATVALPALDLPVSRTGVQVYYPPTVRLTVEPGGFRTEEFVAPASSALNGSQPAVLYGNPPPVQLDQSAGQMAAQALVDKYNARAAARRSAVEIPLLTTFPEVGPSVFLASELTGENQAARIEMSYQPEKKRGEK